MVKGDTLAEWNMFGGVCFTLNGSMVWGVNGSDLMMKCHREYASMPAACRLQTPLLLWYYRGG